MITTNSENRGNKYTPDKIQNLKQVLHTVRVRTRGRYSHCIATDGSFKSNYFSQ
jgi:hypothetical protein